MAGVDVTPLLAAERADQAAMLVLAHGPALLPEVLVGDDPRKDLVAGLVCAKLVEVGRPRSVLGVVDAWLKAFRLSVPRRYGGRDARTTAASAYFAARVRDGLIALFTARAASPAPPAFTEREEFLLLYLWRQFYLNPFSALHLTGGMDPSPAPPGTGDVVASLHDPFGAPDREDADRLWTGPDSVVEKTLAALWLMALPQYGLERAACARALANTTRLCRGALAGPPLPASSFEVLVAEAMAALFGACYGGENTVAGLSALGDLVAAEMPRRLGISPVPPDPPPRVRPRIGYLSASFRGHSVSHYLGNRILHHDRGRYEVIAFSVGPRRDWMTDLIEKGSDEFVEVGDPQDLRGIVAAVRARALDLLVVVDVGMDPTLHFLGAVRMARRQIGVMGHATSTGLPTLSHYLSGDHEGPGAESHYSERLVRLPNLGAAQIPAPETPAVPWRRDLKIPDDAVVFVNLNNGIKLLPERDWIYWEILARVPGSILVMKPFFETVSVDPRLARRLLDGAAARGVADRVRIVPPLARPNQVQSLLAIADVHLDTSPFGGWTTNLDALWAGVPMVTQEGRMGVSRWGATFLRKLGITDGIATDEKGYVEEAVRLGSDAALRARLRARIRERARGLFFDGAAAQPTYEEALLRILEGPVET